MSLEEEFSRYSNNQAYEAVFASRMMLRDPEQKDRVLGNTQRDDFLPVLHGVLGQLPPRPHLLDVGAGAGDIVDLALRHLVDATLHVEEPNQKLLDRYRERMAQYPALRCGHIFAQSLQEVIATWPRGEPPLRVDIVLAVHMLYFVSDLVGTLRALYQCLNPGGVLFVVVADQLRSTTGRAGRYHYECMGDENRVNLLDLAWKQRDKLLGQGDISNLLDPLTPPRVDVVRKESWLYGRTEDDLVAMCLSGELLVADDQSFDLRKLESCRKFLNHHGGDVDFGVEERDVPQRGWFRSLQPQIVTTIRRDAL
jgi:SAM-dependent methyltransferase